MASIDTEQNVELMIQNSEETEQTLNPTDDPNNGSQIENTDENNDDDNVVKPKIDLSQFKSTLEKYDIDAVHEAITEYIQERNAAVYPAPFLDNLFPRDWHDHAVPPDNPNLNFKSRVRRSFLIVATPLIFIIIATVVEVEMSDIIGGCLLAMFTLYFSQVGYYVFCAKGENGERKLYRVYSVSDVPGDWTELKTGYLQLLYRDESIQSISELSAINGGVTKTMLNTLGAYTWCAVLIHFVGQLYYNRAVFEWDPADICAIVGTTGLLLISIFELDPFSKPMQIMHYAGAALGTCTIIGYCLQQSTINEKFWFSMLIAIFAGIFFSLWTIVGIATDLAQIKSKAKYMPEYQQRIKEAQDNGTEVKISCFQPLICSCFKNRTVNSYSKLNIVFEAIFLYLGSASLCLFLLEYDRPAGCFLGCSHGKNFDWSCFCAEE